MCGYVNDDASEYTWQWHQGPAIFTNTGPQDGDHTTGSDVEKPQSRGGDPELLGEVAYLEGGATELPNALVAYARDVTVPRVFSGT